MKIFLKKLKHNKGFTLPEALIAVAVLVILMGISMPLITDWNTRLEMTELDNHAKTIFLEVQNQLFVKKVEGSLPKLKEELQVSYSGNALNYAPQDFDVDLNGELWKSLYQLEKNHVAVMSLLPSESNSHQMEGNYLVEFNPETGEVYGVFYWKKDNPITYATDISRLPGRDLNARTPLRLGYYGGQLNLTGEEGYKLRQHVQLVNSEELYLKIAFDYSAFLVEAGGMSKLSINCKITDQSGNLWETVIPTTNYVQGEKIEVYYLLDSMDPNNNFESITENLIPGENLTIEVNAVYDNEELNAADRIYATDKDVVTGNSLFADRSEDKTLIGISALRHLRNLEAIDGSMVTVINQKADIDFEGQDYAWKYDGDPSFEGRRKGVRPIDKFVPLKNSNILVNTSEDDRVTFNGNNYKLKNFIVEENANNNVGIFSAVSYVNFENIKIEDIKVIGQDSVGALAGSLSHGKVKNCGVYLTTFQTDGIEKKYYYDNVYTEGEYRNEMEERYDERCITGNSNVGGLFGICTNDTIVEKSFSAIKIKGKDNLGGFAGNTTDTTISNSYSSGDVYGENTFGGFLGSASNTVCKNSYTTSDLHGAGIIGGFVGTVAGGGYTNCISYGEILDKEDLRVPQGAKGFVAGNTDSTTYSGCHYLRQEGYNAEASLENPIEGITPKGYEALSVSGSGQLAVNTSFPYDDGLRHHSFPFLMQTGSHYGNWPGKYSIDTSLVYYEKYGDGTYGYYCETKISALEEGAEQNLSFIWVLDSLREEECVEDGYALLSRYHLSRFDYSLDIGSTDQESQKGTLTVVEAYTENRSAESLLLQQQTALEFKGFEQEMEEYRGQNAVDKVSIGGMYLYQLPYELQCTDRSNVDNFYDRFIVYNGYLKGDDSEDSTPIVGGDTRETGENFFYCPHFAKTAINPGMEKAGENHLKNPQKVFVRSARQLNSLGRYTYYWNPQKGYTDKINFLQETDINFGTYTNGTKIYCGMPFDLMDVDGPVKNQAIGRTREDPTHNFTNNYNGQCYRIIDYCMKSNTQFTGLFGEIMGAKLENIVMTVSEEGKGVVSSVFNNGTYRTGIGALLGLAFGSSNTINNCTSVGYRIEYSTEYSNDAIVMGGLIGVSMAPVTNCSAENDIILYDKRANYNKPIYLGGLVGSQFFGDLENCYSGGTIAIKSEEEGVRKNTGKVVIGGVTPGYLYFVRNKVLGETNALLTDGVKYSNIYSYTDILAKPYQYNNADRCVGNNVLTTDTEEKYINTDLFQFSNCHYLESVSKDVVEITKTNVSPITEEGLMKLDLENKNDTGLKNRVSEEENEPGAYTYPIDEKLKGRRYPYPTVLTKTTPAYGKEKSETYNVHYGDWEVNIYKELPMYFEKYEDGEYRIFTVFPEGETYDGLYTKKDGKRIIDSGYGIMTLKKEETPENSLKNRNGNNGMIPIFTHELYGLTYYCWAESEINDNKQSISFSYKKVEIDKNFNVISIEEKGEEIPLYINGLFAAAISTKELGTSDNPFMIRRMLQFTNMEKFQTPGNVKEVYFLQTYDLYLDEKNTNNSNYMPVSVNTALKYDGGAKEGYGIYCASSSIFSQNEGTITNCYVYDLNINKSIQLTVSKQNNGNNENGNNGNNGNIYENGLSGFVLVNKGNIENCRLINPQIISNMMVVKGKNYENSTYFVPNTAGFAVSNTGTLKNCGILGELDYSAAYVAGGNVAGFVGSNGGSISSCFVEATIETNAVQNYDGIILAAPRSSGFVGENKGKDGKKEKEGIIEYSYSNSQVKASQQGAEAYGFVGSSSTEKNLIEKCYSAGTVKANETSGTAYGFLKEGSVKSCYTLSELSGKMAEGFTAATNKGIITDCYWLKDGKWSYNEAITSGKGLEATLRKLQTFEDYQKAPEKDYPFDQELKLYSVEEDTDSGEKEVVTYGNYPYPSVGISHYGDWPALGYFSEDLRLAEEKYIGIFYYEKYGEEYGIYGLGQEPASPNSDIGKVHMDTLEGMAGMQAEEHGFGIFFGDGSGWSAKEGDNTTSLTQYVKDKGEDISSKVMVSAFGKIKNYKFYTITSEMQDCAVTFSYKKGALQKEVENKINSSDIATFKSKIYSK